MVKGSKVKERLNFKHAQMAKVAVSMCLSWINIKNCQRRPLYLSYGVGSKVKERSNFAKYRRDVRLCSDLFTDVVLLSSVNISLTYISDMT